MKHYLSLLFLAFTFTFSYAETTSIATGHPSGLYYPYGGGLASIWSRYVDGFNAKAEVTSASLANVVQVHRKEAEAGIAMGNVTLAAYRGEGRFPYPLDIKVLFALYPNLVHIMALKNSSINSIQDLRGKKVSLGAPGSGTVITANNVLNTLGIDTKDFSPQYLNYSETADAIRDGHIDAGFIVGGIGVATIVELALTRDIKLVPITAEEAQKIIDKYPAYGTFKIPGNVYNGIADVDTLSVWNTLVVHKDMDKDLAYTLTKTLFEHKGELEAITYVARYTTPENADILASVPLHPGSARYFNELKENSSQSH